MKLSDRDMLCVKDGYFAGYDPSVNPTATNSFVSQVFR